MKTKLAIITTIATLLATTGAFAASEVLCPSAAEIQTAQYSGSLPGNLDVEGFTLNSTTVVVVVGASNEAAAQTLLNNTTAPYSATAKKYSIYNGVLNFYSCAYAPYGQSIIGTPSVIWVQEANQASSSSAYLTKSQLIQLALKRIA